jgi:hypothetical protein
VDTVNSESAIAQNTPSAPSGHQPCEAGEDKADDTKDWLPRLNTATDANYLPENSFNSHHVTV